MEGDLRGLKVCCGYQRFAGDIEELLCYRNLSALGRENRTMGKLGWIGPHVQYILAGTQEAIQRIPKMDILVLREKGKPSEFRDIEPS